MPMRLAQLRFVVLVIASMGAACNSAAALDPLDLSTSGDAALAGPGSSRAQDNDDDEDTFFSSSRRNTTGSVASVGTLPSPAVRPMVDVAATCRAVLADNLNYYNYKFIEGCKRAVAQGARR